MSLALRRSPPGLKRLPRTAAKLHRWFAAAGAVACLSYAAPLCAQSAASRPVDFPSTEEDAAAPRAASAPGAAASSPVSRAAGSWRLVIEAPDDLKSLLQTYLDLARYEREGLAAGAPTDQKAIDQRLFITRGELRRLVAALPAQAHQLLESEGYMDARVEARVEPSPSPDMPQIVRVKVTPGPDTMVREVTLRFEGELDQRFETRQPDAVALQAMIRREWALPPGSPFRQDDWNAAKNAAVARLRAEGYPAASWSGTSARIDVRKQSATLFALADTGPLFHFGEVKVEGLQYYSADSVRYLQTFRTGDAYSDKAVFDYQERLQKLAAFESVAVTVDTDISKAAAAPVTVQLREQPRRAVTFGVGVSSNTGPRVSTEYIDRHLFGLKWQSKITAELGSEEKNLKADFSSYPMENRHRNMVSLGITNLEAAGVRTTGENIRVGRIQDGERIERTAYVEWLRATVRNSDKTIVSQASSLTANYQWIWRHLDNIVLPTDGWAVSLETGAGKSFAGLDAPSGFFLRERLRLLGYQPLGGDWYLNGRFELGAVQAKPDIAVPDTLLFRAGGDDSVRGYQYRAIGPTRDGSAVGGRVLTTGTLELARPLFKRHPAWWIAAFIDAGDAADNWTALSPKLGYGVGARWRSPVGALRLDLAYGQQAHRLRLHFSVGIAF